MQITNRNIEAMNSIFWACMPVKPRPVHLMVAPMTHAAGVCSFPLLAYGGTNIFMGTADPGAILAAIEKHDLVLGSRYVPGGGVKNWGLLRKFISRGGSLYARTILGLSLRDLTGGFKCFRRQVLESIYLDAVKSNGYSFQIEMTYRARCKGFRICETPIVFEDRTAGKSKMSRKIFLEAVLMVWKLRMDSSISA